jgi:hypothetical protein
MAGDQDQVDDTAVELNERQRAMLHFESNWFTLSEDRDSALRSRFQCSPEEYSLELNRLVDHPAALQADPLVVRRLLRARDRRRRSLIDHNAAGDAQH